MNAAILGTLTPLCHQEPNEFQEVLNVNLIANFRLLRSLELSLKESKNGKLCVISSILTKNPKPFWGAYSISKAALEQMIYSWRLENKKLISRYLFFTLNLLTQNLEKKQCQAKIQKTIKQQLMLPKNYIQL